MPPLPTDARPLAPPLPNAKQPPLQYTPSLLNIAAPTSRISRRRRGIDRPRRRRWRRNSNRLLWVSMTPLEGACRAIPLQHMHVQVFKESPPDGASHAVPCETSMLGWPTKYPSWSRREQTSPKNMGVQQIALDVLSGQSPSKTSTVGCPTHIPRGCGWVTPGWLNYSEETWFFNRWYRRPFETSTRGLRHETGLPYGAEHGGRTFGRLCRESGNLQDVFCQNVASNRTVGTDIACTDLSQLVYDAYQARKKPGATDERCVLVFQI